MTIHILRRLLALVSLTVPTALAQDINVDCGPGPVPSPAFGAASGQAGVWNQLVMPSSGAPLVDVTGEPTTVLGFVPNNCDSYTCGNCGAGACAAFSGTADELALLGSWFNADCGLSVVQVGLGGFEAGRYAVHLYTYGCPAMPAASVNVFVPGANLQFLTPGAVFQGTWSGFPVGRFAFNLSDGGGVSMTVWGTSETGLSGFQLEKLEPTGQVSCLGDGSGAACPCANYGLPGHGCRNSATVRGAELQGVGHAKLGFDSLGMACAFEPPNVTSVLLQGDQLISPVIFGDGLRCVGGNLKRLYVANSTAAGTLTLPANGAPSISARSSALGDTLQPGTPRVYQMYYRDVDPSFCPEPQGSTFNVSNAVEITWQS